MNIQFDAELFNSESDEELTKIDQILSSVINRRYTLVYTDKTIAEGTTWAENARKNYINILKEAFTSTIQSSSKADLYICEADDILNEKMSLKNASIFLNQIVYIYVENSHYDSMFIKGIVASFKKRSKKIKPHIENRWLDFKHCGGKDAVVQHLTDDLKKFSTENLETKYYLRAIVIVDSDKKHESDNDPNRIRKDESIINFCTENNIEYHILEKREMENYIHISLLKNIENINSIELSKLEALSPKERDYFDFELLSSRAFNTKQELPPLFTSAEMNQELFVNVCSHQKDSNELQTILDKISNKI